MKIGVVGVGTIAVAFVKGLLAKYGKEAEVFLSPRNRENALALANAYENVRVMESNQDVLDHCDWVVLCVIPQIAPDVIGKLSFRKNHRVVSFITAFSLEKLEALIGETALLTRMVPLPFIEFCVGPLAAYPVNAEIEERFGCLGDLISASDEAALSTMIAVTALMSPFYAMLGEVVSWGKANQLPAALSADYAISFFQALLFKARNLPADGVLEIWKEMTPGGLNEMAITRMREENAFAPWTDALNAVRDRVAAASN